MQNENEQLCIKYVMNELDPSEIVMVEKAIDTDEDMLIEIESLRSTWKRLEQLPRQNAPDFVLESVLNIAKTQNGKEKSVLRTILPNKSYVVLASAAILMLGVTLGIGAFTTDHSQISTLPAQVSEQVEETTNSGITPWVDRQNILHINTFDSQLRANAAQPDMVDQFRNLRLLDDSATQIPLNRSLQLTRTQN